MSYLTPSTSLWELLIINEESDLKYLYAPKIKALDIKWDQYDATIHDLHKQVYIDSGFDLFIPHCPDTEDGNWIIEGNSTVFIPLGIKLVRYISGLHGVKTAAPYVVHPRSSIWKNTPLRLANCTGIIDAGYRGELCVALDNIRSEEFVLEKNVRLVQACSPDLKPFRVKFTDKLDATERGEGGFGSTGK